MSEVLESDSYRPFIKSIKSEVTKQDYIKGLVFHGFVGVKEYTDIFFKADVKLIHSNIIDFIIDCKDLGRRYMHISLNSAKW